MNIAKEVLYYYKKVFDQHLAAGTSGNVSYYDRETGQVWITPGSMDIDKMTEEDIVVIDLEGNKKKENINQPSSEWRLHAALYKSNSGACAVVHTHSPYASAFSVADIPVPRILVEMDFFTNGEIPVGRFAPCGTEELAQNVACAMNDRSTCLMQNHGAVAIGRSVEEAFRRAAYIEDAARIAYIAQQLNIEKLNALSMKG